VASGLTERIEVSQYRLATHLLLACLIYVATLWTAQGLTNRTMAAAPTRLRASAIALLLLLLVQLYFGALVAGLRAGLIYNTWPSIDGAFIPAGADLFFQSPLWRNFFENRLLVQFDHRMLGYLIWAAALLHVVDVARTRRNALASALALFAALTVQACLGILTLLYQAPLPLALIHQGMAMVVLALASIHAERLFARRYNLMFQTFTAAA
jgi:heme a synthase